MKPPLITITLLLLTVFSTAAFAVERFPPPEFDTEYQLPLTTVPPPKPVVQEYLNLAILLTALALASWLALKKRSRRGIFILMIFSLAYFGFWRQGCICPIGSIQNVALALFDSAYALPIFAIAIFLLPLLFTLFFGRTFCAAVCPQGAIQDLFLIHPLRVPPWLQHALSLLAYVYLAAAVLFAATGSAFIICQYDPFVALFRLSGSINMLILAASFLIISMFVGRPYCRFLCPYGALLRMLSQVSHWRVTITPDQCIQCRLCEDACPFGAIDPANPPKPTTVTTRDKNRLLLLLLLLPLLIVGIGWTCSLISVPLSRTHATVRLAEQVLLEETNRDQTTGLITETTEASDAFRVTGQPVESLYQTATDIQHQFHLGTWLAGGFLGLVIGTKLLILSVFRKRTDYQANRSFCVACARCFTSCPIHRQKLKQNQQN
ncbi:MAG: 4Fe-4S binding protein [Sedimentisphaerales bacterium]|nr:4Fe-4S binding protein [Sedimentisphaerales bacterium]